MMRSPKEAVPAPAPSPGARGLLAAAVAGAVLVFSHRVSATYSLPKLAWLSFGLAAAWAAALRSGTFRVPRTPLDAPLAALASAMLLSTAFSEDAFLCLAGRYRMYAYGVLAFSLYAAAFYLAAASAAARFEGLLHALLAACAVAGGYALLQWSGVELFAAVTRRLPEGRAIACQGSPVYLGACLLLAAPLAVRGTFSGGVWGRFLAVVAGGLVAGGLVATGSRAAWLGAAAGVAAYLGACGRWAPRVAVRWAAGLVAAAAVASVLVVARGTSRSDTARVELWRSALRVAAEHPILGTGPDAFEGALRKVKTERFVRTLGPASGQENAHNDLLQAAATLGLTGLAAYLWLLWGLVSLWSEARRDPARRDAAAAAGGALVGLFVFAKLNPPPLAALAAAAALAGLLAAPGAPPRPRGWTAAALAVCSACALASAWLARADHLFRRGNAYQAFGRLEAAARDFEAASRANPYETDYLLARCQLLYKRAARTPAGAARHALLEEAVSASRASARLRPGHVDPWQALGVSLALLLQERGTGDLAEARAALDRALSLDPTFVPVIESRLKLARMERDAEGERRLAERLRALGAAVP